MAGLFTVLRLGHHRPPSVRIRPSHSARGVLESFDDTGAWFLYPLNYNRDPECLASICRWLLSFERTHFDDDHLSLGHSAGQGSAQSAHVKICRLLGKTLDVKKREKIAVTFTLTGRTHRRNAETATAASTAPSLVFCIPTGFVPPP